MAVQQIETQKAPVRLYYVFSHEDGIFANEIRKYLEILRKHRIIDEWDSLKLTSVTDEIYMLDEYLITAQIVLLLVSPDFLAYDFLYSTALQKVLERHDAGKAIVLPVLLRPADWTNTPLARLQVLPDNEMPIILWSNEDEAYFNIEKNIRVAVTQLSYPQSIKKRGPDAELISGSSFPQTDVSPTRLFLIYAERDQMLLDQFESHLAILERYSSIDVSGRRRINWEISAESETDQNLAMAQVILLFFSPDFLASDYCYGPEMMRSLERHKSGDAMVILIILRRCDWKASPFEELPVLPTDGEPVTSWTNLDAAFLDTIKGIRKFIAEPLVSSNINNETQEGIGSEVMPKLVPFISGPIKIFYSYSRKDKDIELLRYLKQHLAYFKRQMHIIDFDESMLQAGTERLPAIYQELAGAHIILLLISADYFASDYCVLEMQYALERQASGEAIVIPILLRPVDMGLSPIAMIQSLPTDGKPVIMWQNQDEAFFSIAQGLREVILSLATQIAQATKEKLLLEGKTHYDALDYEEALATYQQAHDLDLKDEIISAIIGRILLHLGRHEEALMVYEDILRTSPSASIHLFKGIALQHLGRLIDALEVYQQVREYGFTG